MQEITLETLVGSTEEFHRTYFGRRTLHRPGAIQDTKSLLSAHDLDDLLSLEAIRPPYIKVNLNGSGVPEKGYTRSVVVQGVNVTDTVVADKVYELFKAGATVTWSSLNHVLPKMRELADVVNNELFVRTDPVAFLTPAGKKGYPPHHDPVDLFIIQLSGTKHWKLWNLPEPRKGDNESYSLEELGAPATEITLHAGDVLYLPYGTPHAAEARETTSLHLSVMMRPRMWSDLLLDVVKNIVTTDPAYNTYPLLAKSDSANLIAEYQQMAERVSSTLAERATDADLDWLRAMPSSQGGHGRRSTFESIVDADTLTPERKLVRTGVDLTLVDTIDDRARVKINGSTIAMPTAVATHLADIPAGSYVDITSLPGRTTDPKRQLAMIKALVRLDLVRGAA